MNCVWGGWLWVGSARDSRDLVQLRAAGIERIFGTLGPRLPGDYVDSIEYGSTHFEDMEHEELSAHIDQCNDFLRASQKRPTLVHCQAGMSRSPALVIAYLMMVHGLTYFAALATVREKRSCVEPNYGFRVQLIELDLRLATNHPLPLAAHLIASKAEALEWGNGERTV